MEEDYRLPATCDHCGKEDGDWCINPYHEDIDGIEVWEFICSDCYNALLGDI